MTKKKKTFRDGRWIRAPYLERLGFKVGDLLAIEDWLNKSHKGSMMADGAVMHNSDLSIKTYKARIVNGKLTIYADIEIPVAQWFEFQQLTLM